MTILFIILGSVALFLIVPIFLPRTYNVEKTISTEKPARLVFEKVADLNNYREWNPWQKMEPSNKSQITGSPALPGHKFSWEGKKIGIGSLTVRSIDHPKSIELDLVFIKPFASKANDSWKFVENNGSTKVTWQNSGKLPYPMGRLMGAAINKNLNKQFEAGLKNLKELCEK